VNSAGALTLLMSLFHRKPISFKDFEELQESRELLRKYMKINQIAAEGAPRELIVFLLNEVKTSKAQQLQDLLAVFFSSYKPGYFVEFGATDGIDLSNTYILEKLYEWEGILSEPAKVWLPDLLKNRDVNISSDCVYSESDLSLEFLESKSSKLSSLSQFAANDSHTSYRSQGAVAYQVKTISLNDLLLKHNAPKFIDFLSVDTEGSELRILEFFDFSKHNFGFISVEHNYTENDLKMEKLLAAKGYLRILKKSSDFDGWYLHESIFSKFKDSFLSEH
jgi:FkbM family methyltransferase